MNQKVIAFWELGMGNWELLHRVFLQIWDAPHQNEDKGRINLLCPRFYLAILA